MSLVETYFRLHREYEKKYGDSVCLLIQVGKFYEAYQYDPSRDSQPLQEESNLALKYNMMNERSSVTGKAVELSLLLNMKLTSKNKEKPHSLDNPMMMGFPCPSYENHRDLILMNGYTIIRIDQKGKGEQVEREVVEVSSSGTELAFTKSSNNVVSIYLECQKTSPHRNLLKAVMVCGLSSLDICTGKSIIAENYSKENDETYALLEVYRFLEAQKPIEVIIHLNKIPVDQVASYQKYLQETLELDRYSVRVVKVNEIEPAYFKDQYQESMLQKAFGSSYQPGTTNLIYEMDLELFRYGLISYVVLLQYCYEHNEKIIDRLQKPKVGFTDQGKHLILTHNAVNQLNLVSQGRKMDSLLSILDITSTDVGSRYLRQQILNPITDPQELELRYSMIQELLDDSELRGKIEPDLRRLPDIERLQRKSQIGLLKPKEFVNLFAGYFTIQQIYRHLFDTQHKALSSLFMEPWVIEEFNRVLTELWTKIDLEKLERAKIVKGQIQTHESFFNPNQDPEVDGLQQNLLQAQNWLQMICQHLNEFVGSGRGKKIEPTYERSDEDDEEGALTIHLHTTPAKAAALKRSQMNVQLCGNLEFQETRAKSKIMITSDVIRYVISTIESYQRALEQKLTLKYNQLVAYLGASKFLSSVAHFVAKLDFVKTGAQLALKYNYFRPILSATNQIKVVGLRHPLVERLIRTEYIPNDLEFTENGIIDFGINSAGKTTLVKALGCSIVMAQAGLFVPGKMLLCPQDRIITRLTGEDDLLAGKSSFIVEMSEANTILRNADRKTLVLGDELCRGTESLSGMSLTVAMIKTLADRGVHFIFSTHMHHLPKIDVIQDLVKAGKLQIKHLSAEYNLELDQLVYSRKLEDGPGSSLYGLEVCKSLAMDPAFLEYANSIRRKLEGIPDKMVNTKPSRYNSKFHKSECFICKTQIEVQTHHLREQSEADERGYIDHVPKDASYNLLAVCKPCHQKIHQDSIKITPQQTLLGVKLQF